MAWLELHLTTTAEQAEHVADQLALLGANALTLRDAGDRPIYEPDPETISLWQDTVVTGLFPAEQPLEAIINYLKKQQALGVIQQLEIKEVADEDWERRCLDTFVPICFAKNLWVCPSWQTPPDPNAINIILDPGLAFGTGTHATTALCLEWLAANIDSQEIVIDYGCGSGILALAALKLGAQRVFAVDHDPQALQATTQNGKINQLASPELEVYSPDVDLPNTADLLIANILAKPLISLAEYFSRLVKPQGQILLSGVLKEQKSAIIQAYEPWFDMQVPVFKEEWTRLVGIRK